MGVPQLLGDVGCSQIMSLVIADDAILSRWQMLGEGVVETGKTRGQTASRRGVGFRDYSLWAAKQSAVIWDGSMWWG